MGEIIAISAGQKNIGKLWIAFGLTAGYMAAEAAGGFLTRSLALLADAGHMLTDAGALGLALFAIHYAQRPATSQKTYGYLRTEILAALVNAVALLLVSFFILYEAWQRFHQPPEVLGGPMLIVGVIGLGVNLVNMRLLASAAGESLIAKGAYLEVLSDMLGSVGVIAASVIVIKTGWYRADPIIGAAIGLFIVPRTWSLLKDATHILLEGAPERIDISSLESAMHRVPGVLAVHDLHVWTLTSGFDSLSAHVLIGEGVEPDRVLEELEAVLKREFELEHTTLQLEKKGRAPENLAI